MRGAGIAAPAAPQCQGPASIYEGRSRLPGSAVGRCNKQKKAPGRLNRRGRVVLRGTLGGSNDDHLEIIGEDSGGIEVVDVARNDAE